ncbi:MAG: cytochrome c [Alphaproteobacteria bacterium]|nr:cytochrome c [Alphaproteobacteria bacterium]
MLGLLIVGLSVISAIYLIYFISNGGGVDLQAGRKFAESNCSRCHAIGPTGASPLDPAVPFRTFAERWPLETLEEALAEGIFTGHPAMPEFELTPQQIRNFIGYLKTIQQ